MLDQGSAPVSARGWNYCHLLHCHPSPGHQWSPPLRPMIVIINMISDTQRVFTFYQSSSGQYEIVSASLEDKFFICYDKNTPSLNWIIAYSRLKIAIVVERSVACTTKLLPSNYIISVLWISPVMCLLRRMMVMRVEQRGSMISTMVTHQCLWSRMLSSRQWSVSSGDQGTVSCSAGSLQLWSSASVFSPHQTQSPVTILFRCRAVLCRQ